MMTSFWEHVPKDHLITDNIMTWLDIDIYPILDGNLTPENVILELAVSQPDAC